MVDYKRKYDEVKEVMQEWIDKQGHDRCWWHPELFSRLAKILEVEPSVELLLPPEEEFRQGCERYRLELYHPEK